MILTGPLRVFFDAGDILINHIFVKDKDYYGLGFAQVEPGEIGRQEKKWEECTPPRQVEFLFSNIESLNVLIEGLKIVKENFKEKENE